MWQAKSATGAMACMARATAPHRLGATSCASSMVRAAALDHSSPPLQPFLKDNPETVLSDLFLLAPMFM